jgi:serine/threonine protein kinase
MLYAYAETPLMNDRSPSRGARPANESGEIPSSRKPTTSRCLSDDEAIQFVSRAAHPSGDATIQRHLDECARCRILIGEAARSLMESRNPQFRSTPSDLPRTFSVGQVVMDRFEIVRFVARGGMGEVYEARDAVLKETVALKTLVSTSLDDEAAMSRLMAEVRLARHVTHPNVCRILEFGHHRTPQGEAVPFLTMEFLHGETLARRLEREGRLAPHYVADLLAQAAAGLTAIHAAGIVHRDVKPQNIVLLPGSPERLVLTDFGLARALKGTTTVSNRSGSALFGTLDYLAPELIEGKTATPSSDIYALGIVLFEMLTGTKPFAPITSLAGAAARRAATPRRPSEIVAGLDRTWDDRVAGCLARRPEQRFASANELVVATEPRASRPRPARLVALAAAAAVSAILAFALGARWRASSSAKAARGEPAPVGSHALATPLTRKPPHPVQRVFNARGCSEDMVRVADRFCIDRFEAAIVDDVQERLVSPYYPPTAPLIQSHYAEWTRRLADGQAGSTLPLPVVSDWQLGQEWAPRAVSRGGVTPQGYVSKFVAEAACANAGKRLCTADEWKTACRGETGSPFPYGPTYVAQACNVDRAEHPGEILHGDRSIDLTDPRMNTVNATDGPFLKGAGTTPRCRSIWGDDAVYDMVGNLDEWVAGGESAFYGGFYSRATTEGCESKNARHPPSYFNYSIGFRCCDSLR